MNVVIGAGISGLTAAGTLRDEVVVLEREDHTGGLSTQYKAGDYWFDYGGHYFHFLNKEDIRRMVEKVCAFKGFNRKSKTFALDRYVPFPLQYHLSYLPAEVRNQAVREIRGISHTPADNLGDFLEKNFGPTLFKLFFQPFLGKYYGMDLRHMIANMDRGSIPPPDPERVIAGARGQRHFDAGYNPRFYYPRRSLKHFIDTYTASVAPGRIRLNETVTAVDIEKKTVFTRKGEYHYDKLISTIPLNRLVGMLNPGGSFPGPGEFRHISTLLVNAVLSRRRKRFHWVYVADPKIPFYRAGFYPVHTHPACYLERTIPADMIGRQWDKKALRDEIAFTLRSLGLIEMDHEIEFFDARVIPVSYILFTRGWRELVPPLLERLRTYGIYSIGRYGTWDYTSMSDDIKGALACAAELNKK